jgi:hypothetical protein
VTVEVDIAASSLAAVAIGISLLSWRTSSKAKDATERQAVAAEEAAREARAGRELLQDQIHQQNKPTVKLTIGELPETSGWLTVELWIPVEFESAKVTMPDQYRNELFAGLGPGPTDPDRNEFSNSFELPGGAGGTTVRCGLWVYNVEELALQTFQLLYEIKPPGGPAWHYHHEETFPETRSPNVWT